MKSKRKTKRISVWCERTSLSRWSKKQPKRHVELNERSKRERCPDCGRMLRLKTVDVEPNDPRSGEYVWHYPKHKRLVKPRKKK